MKLANATLLPGVVVSAEDPKNLGRIKCIIAGSTNPDTMNTEHLPWCAPLMSFGYQRISKPMEGQKVWVLHDESNYYEYYYLPAFEVNANTEVITPGADYDVVVSRPGEGFGAQQYYCEEQGFVTRLGNDLQSTMTKDGSIVHTNGEVEIGLKNGQLFSGKVDGDYEPMVLGTKIYDLLSDLAAKLNTCAQEAANFCYTTKLGKPLLDCASAITDNLPNILSKTSNVN